MLRCAQKQKHTERKHKYIHTPEHFRTGVNEARVQLTAAQTRQDEASRKGEWDGMPKGERNT